MYSFLTIVSLIGTIAVSSCSGSPLPDAGISQVGYNIYPDAQSYYAARIQRERQRAARDEEDKVVVAYTVQHPKNPNQARK